MDITIDNFWENLPTILLMIASSDFIALDMEMTGIKVADHIHRKDLTLDIVYQRVQEAASTFQPLQLGMTCIRWYNGCYQTFTFSIATTPMIRADSKLSVRMTRLVDRTISLSSDTLVFLESHGFDLRVAFQKGVPYLNRQELDDAYGLFVDAHDALDLERIDLLHMNKSQRDFYFESFNQITEWLKNKPEQHSELRIFDPDGGTVKHSTRAIVHHLILETFPNCRCWRNADCWAMVVKMKDGQEESIKDKRKEKAKETILQQLALMCNNLLSQLWDVFQPQRLLKTPDAHILSTFGQNPMKWLEDPQKQWRHLLGALEKRKPVIIGHNLVYDLCFLHVMTMGELPLGLEVFRNSVHENFPRLFDTKVLVSQQVDPVTVDQRLEDIFGSLETQADPVVESMAGWSYNRTSRPGTAKSRAHNAGYDIYMTAMIFLKISTRQLSLQGKRLANGKPNEWPIAWVPDPPDHYDPYELRKSSYDNELLPSFDTGFYKPVRNQLRMSSVGLLNMEEAYSGPDKDKTQSLNHDASISTRTLLNNKLQAAQLKLGLESKLMTVQVRHESSGEALEQSVEQRKP